MKIELSTMELSYAKEALDQLREEQSLNPPFTKNTGRIETAISVLYFILERAHFLPDGRDIHASLMEDSVPNGHHDPTIEFADDF